MPPRKKTNLSRLTAKATRMRRKRATESPTQREKRLERGRLRLARKRATETPEQREQRLKIDRIRMRQIRKSRTIVRAVKSKETSPNYNIYISRLERGRLSLARKRATETPEQREQRLKINRIHMRQIRKSRTIVRAVKSKETSPNSFNSGAEDDFILNDELLKQLSRKKYKSKVVREEYLSINDYHDCEEKVDIKLEPPSSPLPFLPV